MTGPIEPNGDQQRRRIKVKAQCLTTAACRLRLASIQAEFRPVRIMMGHKNVQTMAHKTRAPKVEPPSGVSDLWGPSLKMC